MNQRIVLNTGTSLATFLDGVFAEGIKSAYHQRALQEKEKQSQASDGSTDNSGDDDGGDTDLFSGDGSGDDGGGDQQQQSPPPSKTMDADAEHLKQGNVEPKDVIDKLNAIRSGKSFKDDRVGAAMDEYVGSLSKAEKVALLAFLKGIAQIVTGEVGGQQADSPDSHPADVEMEKGKKQATKHITPNVIKGVAPKQKPKGNAEDTSGPVPITPKKK